MKWSVGYKFTGFVIDAFAVNPQFGQLRTSISLDRESLNLYNLTITATDGGLIPLSSLVSVVIIVTDMNDNAPGFNQSFYSVIVPENQTIGTILLKVRFRIIILMIFLMIHLVSALLSTYFNNSFIDLLPFLVTLTMFEAIE